MTRPLKIDDAVTGQRSDADLASAEPVFDFVNRSTEKYRQLVHRWNNRFQSKGESVAEAYRVGRLSLVLNLRVSVSGEGNIGDLSVDHEPGTKSELRASVILDSDAIDETELGFCDQEPMFVLNVEVVEMAKEFAISSRVRLYPIHDAVDNLFGGLLFQSAINGVYKVCPALVYRKLGVVRTLSSFQELDLVHHVVEGGAKVVDSISKCQDEVRGQAFDGFNFEHIVSAMRVMLNKDLVRLSFGELGVYQVEIIDVMFGPLDL